MARLFSFLWPYRLAVAVGLVCLSGQIAAELFPPLVWKYVVDGFLSTQRISQLLLAMAVLIASYGLAAVLSGIRVFLLTRAAQGFILDLRRAIYSKLQEQPLSYFQDRRTGDLMSRVVNDVEVVQDVLINGVDSVLASALRLIGVAIIFINLQPVVGILTLVPMAGVAVALYFYNHRIKNVYLRVRGELGQVTAKLQDNLAGMPVIKAFAREDYEDGEFAEVAQAYYDANVAGVALRSRFFPGIRFIANMGQVVMLGLGAWFVYKRKFTIGGLVAYRGYGRYFFGPVDDLMGVNDMLQRASAGAERIFELLDHPPAVQDKPHAIELEAIRGDVEFRDVTFCYLPERPVLNNISLKIQAGQVIGLFGASGIGKTTLMNLIPRFYDVASGCVLVDGVDVRDVTQRSLRSQIGSVQQETFLFNGSVLDNIRYGRLDATREEVVRAAEMANAHDFITALPEKYDTQIGERGARLSGGQRQRLAIARCFLSDPRIILMDEPTSAVEPESERIIIETLQELERGRTTIIVSHRLSLLQQADLILCIENGRAADIGSHNELIEAGGSYAAAWTAAMS